MLFLASKPHSDHGGMEIRKIFRAGMAVLVDQARSTGIREAVWNGRANWGSPAGSGLYFYRFEAGVLKAQGEMLFVR